MSAVAPPLQDAPSIRPPEETDPAGVGRSSGENPQSLGPGEFPGFRRPFRSLWWLFRVMIGLAFLIPLLALLAALPGLNIISLGMLIDAEANVGRTGRFRDGFPLLPVSTRIGTIGIMVGLFLLPIILLSTLANSQDVVREISGLDQGNLRTITTVIQAMIFVHLTLAIANGGGFWRFLRPLSNILRLRRDWKNGRFADGVNAWTTRLLQLFKPVQHLRIAAFAAAGAICWLAIPTLMLGAFSTQPRVEPGGAAFASVVGGHLMIPVAAWLPLLQCHQAAPGRFMPLFEIRQAREILHRPPIRWAGATIMLYGLAVPLYLSKIVVPPADAFWLLTPLFIIIIYPTRLLMGWVYGTGSQREERANALVHWPTRVFMIPLLGLYSLILFAVPLISEAGPRAMFENHAFLLPVPGAMK